MPDWKPALASRFESLRLSPAREQEIIEELSQHLDDIYHDLRTTGASHDDAVRGAVDELDERDLLAREMQRLRQATARVPIQPGSPGTHLLADAIQDVVYTSRMLASAPGWTLVIILLLALGIGANTALFNVTDSLLLAPLPVSDPSTLVRFRWTGRNDTTTDHDEYGFNHRGPDGKPVESSFSNAVFQQLAVDGRDSVDLVACAPFSRMSIVIDGQAELAGAFGATGNYFSVLGVRPAAGRLFTAADDRPSAPPVAVISSQYWGRRFGRDPSAVGKVIKANDVAVTIVGVTPLEFAGIQQPLSEPPDVSFPLTLDLQLKASTGRGSGSLLPEPTAWWLEVMGRLRPGVTAQQLQARLDGVFQQTARANLDTYLKSLSDEERNAARNRVRRDIPRLLVDSGRRGVYDVREDMVAAAALLSAVAGVILLIICANVANLMLSRAVARRKEMALRLSLGATRGRLLRQLLTEALLLALVGAALGIPVASWLMRLFPSPASSVGVLHGRTFVFMALVSAVTSLIFGAVPALRATRVDVNTSLKDAAPTIAAGRNLLSRGLLVLQVALSLVLIVGAGLFLQTLNNLRQVDVGFDTRNLLLVRITPQLSGYDTPRATALYHVLIERLSAVAGVRAAALCQPALLAGSVSSTDIFVHGHPVVGYSRAAGDANTIDRLIVSAGFFRTIGLPVVRGRDLTDHDDASAPKVALINEAAARKFFPGEDPLGKRFGQQPEQDARWEVVGIVRDAKYNALREPAPPTVYMPYEQVPRAMATFALRTQADPLTFVPAVREAIRQTDPNLPIADVSTQAEQVEKRLLMEKVFATINTLFGAIALALATIGLFGLMSYTVSRRTAELGIRMALGAERGQVLRMVMRESLLLVAIGMGIGLVLTAGASRFVAALLFGLAPQDVATFAAAMAVMAVMGAIAAYLPARRASRVDPLVALRYE